jgi:hypothetical protein
MPKRIACANAVWFSMLDYETATKYYYSPLCKRKACPTCAKIRKLQIALRIKNAIATTDNTTWYFATITMHKNWHGMGNTPQVRKVMQSGWSRLRKRMARRWKGLLWVKVIEFHKSGTPHIHLVIGISSHYKRHIKTRWLKDNAVACGLGYMALVGVKGEKDQPLDSDTGHNTAFYIAGYVGKGDMIGIRALSYSEEFPPLPPFLDNDLSKWIYEGQNPDFDRLAGIVDIAYKTERNLIDELERQDSD